MRVSIIIPFIRKEGQVRCIEAIRKNAGVHFDEYEIICREDVQGVGCPEMVKELVELTSFDWVMFLGDDTIPEQDFLKHAIDAAEPLIHGQFGDDDEPWGVVGLNTQDDRQGMPDNDHAHWMAHKKMLEYIPGGNFFSTDYTHSWGDDELKDIAIEHDRWVYAEKSRISHDHPVNGAPWDDSYGAAYSDRAQTSDYKTYLTRKIDRGRAREGTKLAICVPLTSQMIYTQFFFSYLTLEFPERYDFFVPNHPGQIDAVRNDLARQSLHRGCTHTLMLDTDQIYHDRDLFQRLLAHGKHVVGGVVHRRYPGYDPLALRYDKEKDAHYGVTDDEIETGGLIEVDATGCGCILFDNRVFLDLQPPWFEMTLGKHGQHIGEDIGICRKLKNKGYDIFVDASLKIGHLFLTEADWMKYKLYKKVKGL